MSHHYKVLTRAALLFVAIASMCRAAPANDFFSAAQPISGQSGSVAGTTVNSTRESGEPYHGGYYGYGSVWYRWTAPASGLIEISLSSSGFGFLLAVYSGNQVTALTPLGSSYVGSQGSVTLSVISGNVYQIAVDNSWTGGAFVLNWAVPPPPPANDNFAAAEVISGQTGTVAGTTVSATRETGEPYHAGYYGVGSVWYLWTAPANGTMEFNTSGSVISNSLAVYTGNQVTGLTPIASNSGYPQSSVTFAVTSGTVYRVAVDSTWSRGAIVLNWAPPPANDSFAAAESLGTASAVSVSGTVRSATSEAASGETDLSYNDFWIDDRTVWYSWTAPAGSAWARVVVSGTNLRNQLAVYTGGTLGSLARVRLNERTIREPNRSTFPVVPGTTYRIRLLVEGSAESDLPFPEVADYTFDLQLQSIGLPNTAGDYLLRGRGRLEEGVPSALVQAKADFASAHALEPTNQEAAVLLALAQLLALEGETGFTTLLGNLGIPTTGALRERGYAVPEDLDGFPVFATGANSSLAVDWLVNHVLPRLVEVRSALNVVTQNSFRTDLTASETGTSDGDTVVDRGDALAMKAGTRALEMLIHLLGTYNLAAPLNDLVDLDRQGQLSAERVLETYQNLLGFATSDRRVQFAAALRDLESDYVIAADAIRDLRAAVAPESLGIVSSRLDEEDADSLRTDLSMAVDSLDQEVLIRGNRVNLSRFLSTSQPLRDWLPELRGNDALDSFPDPTFDGILPGNTRQVMDNRLYELGRLWGMGQYTTEVGALLELYGFAAAPGEDADGDGKSNFNEWIFGSDPASGEVMHQAELSQVTIAGGQREIRFSFVRTINLQDWRLVVAVSDDLVAWDDTQATVEPVGLPVPTGDGFSEVVTYRLKPQPTLPLKKYFRVESRPNP